MSSTTDAGSGNGCTILVVDDEPAVCELLKTFLVHEGYNVCTAYDGDEALRSVEIHHPLVVLLDIRMPRMNGAECLRQIKATHPDIGVVMVTASEDEVIGRRCLELGAFEYVMKPISLERLKTCLLLAQLFLRK